MGALPLQVTRHMLNGPHILLPCQQRRRIACPIERPLCSGTDTLVLPLGRGKELEFDSGSRRRSTSYKSSRSQETKNLTCEVGLATISVTNMNTPPNRS